MVLISRGHSVRFFANDIYKPLIVDRGIHFVSIGTSKEAKVVELNPLFWDKDFAGTTVLQGYFLLSLHRLYKALLAHLGSGQTIILSNTVALAERTIQEKYDIPLATCPLAPTALNKVVTKIDHNRVVAPKINAFRTELGLPPITNILDSWVHSPQQVIGLFPEWFAPYRSDWADTVRLTDFPLFDESDQTFLPPDMVTFLDAYETPLVFTFGTGMRFAHQFFEESVKACLLLDKPGILLSRHSDHIPDNLPASIKHFRYVPLSLLLKHASLIVHHGGIGTCSQAFRAGVPQLINPLAHDQFDNAKRVMELGLGSVIKNTDFSSFNIAPLINQLLRSQEIKKNCLDVKHLFNNSAFEHQICSLAEELPSL